MSFGKNNKQYMRERFDDYSGFGPYNPSNRNNSSHRVDVPTNMNLPAIDLEAIDQAVFREFDQRFVVDDRQLKLFSGDAETTSLAAAHPQEFDPQKGFLSWPFFIFTRTETNKVWRTSPAFKQVLFTVPKKKAQGIVVEEYISEGPINYELMYEFKFISYFREHCNLMEQQMNYYFRNKRNIIDCGGERFSIGPENRDSLCSLEMANRDEASQMTMYILTFKTKLWCWTRRGIEDMQVRERPNSYTLTMTIQDRLGRLPINSTQTINVETVTITDPTPPDEKLYDVND